MLLGSNSVYNEKGCTESVAARDVFSTIFAQKRVTAPETSWYRNTGEIDNHKRHNKRIITVQS